MNIIFKKRQYSFFVQLLLITVILFGIHSYLNYHFSAQELFFPIWQIYLFHFIITLTLYTLINYKYSQNNTKIFNAFMLSTLLKMILAILFLLPLLLSSFDNKIPDVFNFFIPYFLFLIFEIYSITSLLKED
jgi:hypothetical protein